MVMQRSNQQQQQEGYPHVIPCYDEIITFLKSWFPKYREKPIQLLNRYSDSSAKYTSVVKWSVSPDCNFAELGEISIVCDNYTPLRVRIQVAGNTITDKQLQAPLTLPYHSQKILPQEVIEVQAKSDGSTSINCDVMIVGKEKYTAT